MVEISKDKIDKYDKIFNAICIKGMIEWDLIGFKVKYPSLYKCIIQSMDIVENQISPKRNNQTDNWYDLQLVNAEHKFKKDIEDIVFKGEPNFNKPIQEDYRIIDNANII